MKKSFVMWFTGLSGSGKSTLALASQKQIEKKGHKTFYLDGDNLRTGLNSDLGFRPKDRRENIRRSSEVAKLFVEAGFVVLASFISPYKEDRKKVRKLFKKGEFIEVYVKCSIEECKKRDVKGLYKKAGKGKIGDFTGLSAPYEEPKNPEIVLETDQSDITSLVNKLMAYLKTHKYL